MSSVPFRPKISFLSKTGASVVEVVVLGSNESTTTKKSSASSNPSPSPKSSKTNPSVVVVVVVLVVASIGTPSSRLSSSLGPLSWPSKALDAEE